MDVLGWDSNALLNCQYSSTLKLCNNLKEKQKKKQRKKICASLLTLAGLSAGCNGLTRTEIFHSSTRVCRGGCEQPPLKITPFHQGK